MSERPESRYPALAHARAQVTRMEQAQKKLDQAWAPIRRIATVCSLVFPGAPLAVLTAAQVNASGVGEEPAAVFYAILFATSLGANLSLRALQRYQQRVSPLNAKRLQVFQRCAELEPLPHAVATPLNRAVDSYSAVFRIAEDPIWKAAKLSHREFLQRATERMQELCDWARRLKLIDARLRQLTTENATHPEYRETIAHYRLQCEQFVRAADVFTQAEAKMTRAFATMSGEQSKTMAADELRNLSATFDALTEIATSLEWRPSPTAETAPAPLRVGRGE